MGSVPLGHWGYGPPYGNPAALDEGGDLIFGAPSKPRALTADEIAKERARIP